MRFILLMLLCVFTLNVFGQGIDFFKGNLSEALTKARSENKIVFVDFVASGSEPCEQMSAEVFSQEIISAYFNQRFICVQIDVEKEKELTQKYDVTRVPSMLFFSPEGKIGQTNCRTNFFDGFSADSDVCCWRSFVIRRPMGSYAGR